MKRTTIYRRLLLLLALPAIMLTACTKDDALNGSGEDNGHTAVLFTAAIQPTITPAPATRTTPGADASQTGWTKDDRIGVFMLSDGGKIPADTLPDAHNVPYSVDPATGAMTQVVSAGMPPIYYPMTDDKVDFVAYYPYAPALESVHPTPGTPYIYSINLQDQTTAAKQYANDVLYSDNARGISRSTSAVALSFRHLHAKLRLDITLDESLAGGDVTKVTLPGMPTGVEFDMRNGSIAKISSWSPDDTPISCLKLPSTTGATVFTALVPPQEADIPAGRQITVTVDGEDYTGSIPDTDAYRGNTMYAYPVTVTPRGLVIDAPTGDLPWTDTQALPEGYDLTVANEEQLRAFALCVNTGGKINGKSAHEAYVLQIADITLTKEWTPISNSYANAFCGAYNGNGHTITGLTITTEPPVLANEAPAPGSSAYTGLFSFVQEAVLTGIHLRDVQINIQMGSDVVELDAGSIVGGLLNSTLSLCSATGTVNVENSGVTSTFVGGIAGATLGSTISRCRAAVETTAFTTHAGGSVWAGGITGRQNDPSFILSCEVQGSVVTAKGNKSTYAGGIAGEIYGDCFTAFCRTGKNVVTARGTGEFNRAGGLVGYNGGYLYSCYSRATATATGGVNNYAGAIVGFHLQGDVLHCYGTGAPGPGTSNLAAVSGSIVYDYAPNNADISILMTGYKGAVESITDLADTYYPHTTHYNPSVFPSHGIEPLRVKWKSDAWKNGTNLAYPEIDMEYEGEPNVSK